MNSIPYPSLLTRLQLLARRPFMRNVAAAATGTAAAQAVAVAFSPLIARLYGPAAFGELGTFTAVLGVLAPVAALTYPIAMVLPREDDDARHIAMFSLVIALATSCALALVLLVWGEPLASLLQLQTIGRFLIWLPLAMFLSACLQVADQWRIRKKQFATAARVSVLQAFIVSGSKVGIGWFHPVAAVLIIVTTLGNGLYAAMLSIGMRISDPTHARPEGERTGWKTLAQRYRDFPIYRAPQVCLNAASQSLPVILLASFFGPASAGFYTLGRTVMAMPVRLIGKSVGDVFYPRFTEAAHQRQNLARLILKATGLLAVAGFIPFALVVAVGPWLFALVFGKEWLVAGEYARWLSVWLFFGFLNRPSVAAIATLSLQRFFLGFEVVSIAVRVVAIWLGFFWFHSDVVAVAAFSLAGALLNALLILVTIISCARLASSGVAR